MFKNILRNIKAALKGIFAVIATIIIIAIIFVVGPLLALVAIITILLGVGYVVYRINKDAPDLIKDLKQELAKEEL